MRHIIPVSGKDSLTAAIVQKTMQPDLEYEYFFNRTGAELPETDAWLDNVELALNIKIVRLGMSLEDIIYDTNMLPSIKARFCTRLAKIYPMEDYIGKDQATVYYGIRADEFRQGYNNTAKSNITPKYPLIRYGIDINKVWQILANKKLIPPLFFWQKLKDATVVHLDKDLSEYDIKPWEYQTLFSWRTRMNCYFCFFQRRYEWVGLHEHYPDLFQKALNMENDVGSENFTWIPYISLEMLLEDAENIIARRGKKIASVLKKFEADDVSLMDLISCGLYCGK